MEQCFCWKTEGTSSECLILHKSNHKIIIVAFQGWNVYSSWTKNILNFALEALVFFSQRAENHSLGRDFLPLSAVACVWEIEDVQQTAWTGLSNHFNTFISGSLNLTTNAGLGFKNHHSLKAKLSDAGTTYGYNKKKHSQRLLYVNAYHSNWCYSGWAADVYENLDKWCVVVNMFMNPKQLLYFCRKKCLCIVCIPSAWYVLQL